jgi:hypothetical protein
MSRVITETENGNEPETYVDVWTARRFFNALSRLGRLRIISQSGPSTFEAICDVGTFGISGGYLNAITPAYHWHLRLDGFGHLVSRDETHERSGRRVLFFQLRSEADAEPFLQIYLYRHVGEEFGTERERLFGEVHRELGAGVALKKVSR